MKVIVNKERLLKLADHIEELPHFAFDMNRFRDSVYKSPCCIAGYAVHLFSEFDINTISGNDIPREAESVLGLSPPISDKLFCPSNNTANYCSEPGFTDYISKKRAVAVIRHLAEYGVVDWEMT